jgi:hypothetical protein
MLQMFPTLIIPAVIYALIVMAAGGDAPGVMAAEAFSIGMPSAALWKVTWGHILMLIATIMLFFEILKSTRPSREQLVDAGLSVGVFIACFVLFLLVAPFATGEFFLITLMALLDFMASAVIMTRVSQRTVQY